MEPNRTFHPSSTFNITISRDKDLYISDSESEESKSDKSCPSSGSSSPSGSSTATIETSLGTPDVNSANGAASANPFSATSVGCQTPPPSILKDSSRRLSFSVTWAGNDDETSAAGATGTGAASAGATGTGATGTGAKSGADADTAGTTTTHGSGNKKETPPREFLLRCPPGPGDRLEDFGKIARVAEFCQHPVLACFMYTALAVESAIGGGKQESPPVESPPLQAFTAAAPPAGSSAAAPPSVASFVVAMPPPVQEESPADVEPPAASSSPPPADFPVAFSPVESAVPVASPASVESTSPPVASASAPVESTVAASVQPPPVEAPVEAPVGSPTAGQSKEGEAQQQSLEGQGQSSSKGNVEDPPRARRRWGLAKGVAAVAVGIAIGAAFVSRRR